MTSDNALLLSAVREALDATGLTAFEVDAENAGAFLDALRGAGYTVVRSPREPGVTGTRQGPDPQ